MKYFVKFMTTKGKSKKVEIDPNDPTLYGNTLVSKAYNLVEELTGESDSTFLLMDENGLVIADDEDVNF